MWQDAPLSHMTALSPIFHFNASHLLTSPSLFWTGAPNNLPGVSKMKASSFSPLRISSSVAWHAKTETTLAHFWGACYFPPHTLQTWSRHFTVLSPESPQRLHASLLDDVPVLVLLSFDRSIFSSSLSLARSPCLRPFPFPRPPPRPRPRESDGLFRIPPNVSCPALAIKV